MHAGSQVRRRRWEALLGLAAVLLPLAFHRVFVSTDAIVYMADAAQLQFARYRILCDAIQDEAALPLWETLLYGGMPFHASPENPTLWPPAVLFARLLPPVGVINALTLFGLALAASGAYLLVLQLGRRVLAETGSEAAAASLIPAAGAFVAAATFSMSHWTRVDHLNLVAYGNAHALIPWMLLAAEGLLFGPRPLRSAGWLALACAGELFTGGLYVFPYAFLVLALWFVFVGLFGDAERRRRTLVFGSLAAVCAGLMVAAKLLPYFDWVSTTNRSGALALEDAAGRTLGGHGDFDWALAYKNVRVYAGGGWPYLMLLCGLPLLRSGTVRTLYALLVFFVAVGLGGPAHRLLYEAVPPFDQVRNAVRSWSAVNALYPICIGLGTCWLLSRWRALPARPLLTLALGLAIGVPLGWRSFYSTDRHDAALHHPDSFDELVARYTNWPIAARRAGTDWRAFWIDKTEAEGRNEQFISAALNVESVTGYLGHVWPRDLERHLYVGFDGEPLDPDVRPRRLAVLSVRWLVTRNPNVAPARGAAYLYPEGVDGTAVVENHPARPRAIAPGAVCGLVGDTEERVAYALLDDPRLPLQNASLLSLGPTDELDDAELGALDLLLVIGDVDAPLVARADAAGVPVQRIVEPLSLEDRVTILERLFEAARAEPTGVLSFERASSSETRITWGEAERGFPTSPTSPTSNGRFVVVSEPWSGYPGWNVRTDPGEGTSPGPGAALTVRRADGMASAVFLPSDQPGLVASYEPAAVRVGLWIGTVGLLGALLTIALGARARERTTAPAT